MKINKICIGNTVTATVGKDKLTFPMKVVGIGEDYVLLNFEGNEADPWEDVIENIHPIKIDEKYLLEDGWTKDLENSKLFEYWKKWDFILGKEKDYHTIEYWKKGDFILYKEKDYYIIFYKNNNNIRSCIKYIHQLENFINNVD